MSRLHVHAVTLLGFLLILGWVAQASATVTYSYEGNNYTDIIEQIDDGQTYDTSMSVSGWFALDSPLPAASDYSDYISDVTAYSFSDGRHTFTQDNSDLRDFNVATSAGEISQWDVFINENNDGVWDESGERRTRIRTHNGVMYEVQDQGNIKECNNSANCDPDYSTDGAIVFDNPGSWSFVSESVTIDWVEVGDPGNPADTEVMTDGRSTGYGERSHVVRWCWNHGI